MAIFRNQLTEADIIDEEDDGQANLQGTTGAQGIPPEWYVCQFLG